VLSGELHEIKKRYGTNSIHLEYEGDGEFLKGFDFIHRADVYQNYAELELNDISKSSELLSALQGKLILRKFEIVEPSLNSIFINAVGGPEKIEQAASHPIPVYRLEQMAAQVNQDPRVKRLLWSILVLVLFAAGFFLHNVLGENPQRVAPVLFLLGAAANTLRWFMMKKKVQKELREKQQYGEQE